MARRRAVITIETVVVQVRQSRRLVRVEVAVQAQQVRRPRPMRLQYFAKMTTMCIKKSS
jgi:hypothetical protein